MPPTRRPRQQRRARRRSRSSALRVSRSAAPTATPTESTPTSSTTTPSQRAVPSGASPWLFATERASPRWWLARLRRSIARQRCPTRRAARRRSAESASGGRDETQRVARPVRGVLQSHGLAQLEGDRRSSTLVGTAGDADLAGRPRQGNEREQRLRGGERGTHGDRPTAAVD